MTHKSTWGCSSAGRAPALHAGGHRFEPVHLHQDQNYRRRYGERGAALYKPAAFQIKFDGTWQLFFRFNHRQAWFSFKQPVVTNRLIMSTYTTRLVLFDNLHFRHETNTDIKRDRVNYFVAKLLRANGGCLGTKRR